MKIYQILLVSLLIGFVSCKKEIESSDVKIVGKTVDIDGNQYELVKIKNQTWTKNNLKVSRYNNGDTIPQITDPYLWATTKYGAWCYYNNNPETEKEFGKLYNWYALNDIRGISIGNFDVPNKEDYKLLTDNLGGLQNSTPKLTHVTKWMNSVFQSTNESEWTALPSGLRISSSESNISDFGGLGEVGYWWIKDSTSEQKAYMFGISSNFQNCEIHNSSKNNGYSVRLVFTEIINNNTND